jgi:hypothetical protein
MLSNFQLGDRALLQSFLVGQPELRKVMQSPRMQQLRQRVIASYHLGPLDVSETQAYIEHRLRHVGWQEDPQFAPACMPLIHTLSGGIPRRINTLCNRLMLAAFLAEKHAIEPSDVHTIAREMRDELGADAPLAAVPNGAPPVPAEVASAPPPDQLAIRRLEDRLDRVERTVGATIDLLHDLLHPDKAKPGNPAGPP